MGVRIIVGKEQGSRDRGSLCCLYCSTSGWAFGPTFDSEHHADDFLSWLTAQPRDWLPPVEPASYRLSEKRKLDPHDPRSYSDRNLAAIHCRWWTERGSNLDEILEQEAANAMPDV